MSIERYYGTLRYRDQGRLELGRQSDRELSRLTMSFRALHCQGKHFTRQFKAGGELKDLLAHRALHCQGNYYVTLHCEVSGKLISLFGLLRTVFPK